MFSDTARKSTLSDVVSLSDVQKRRAPQNSHSDKSVFNDTAKKSAFSEVAAFGDAHTPRHSHSHDKSVFSESSGVFSFGDAQKRRAP